MIFWLSLVCVRHCIPTMGHHSMLMKSICYPNRLPNGYQIGWGATQVEQGCWWCHLKSVGVLCSVYDMLLAGLDGCLPQLVSGSPRPSLVMLPSSQRLANRTWDFHMVKVVLCWGGSQVVSWYSILPVAWCMSRVFRFVFDSSMLAPSCLLSFITVQRLSPHFSTHVWPLVMFVFWFWLSAK